MCNTGKCHIVVVLQVGRREGGALDNVRRDHRLRPWVQLWRFNKTGHLSQVRCWSYTGKLVHLLLSINKV